MMLEYAQDEISAAGGLSDLTAGLGFPPVLDACCGSRMFWFDKQDGRALFVDKRRETWPIDIGTPGTKGRSPIVVDPDEIADFTSLPYPDATFALVVFDPPHIERTEAKGLLTRKYGHLTGDWRAMLRDCDAVLATIEADDGDEAQKLGDLRMALAYAIDPYKREGTLL